uniref:Reverse transcriptase domain-containing protein n=1 Tax=Tanacetum cinerariifolium TaxID=118510 RepID=A0A6L2P5E5_TANCI|nr:reverse transcriptase domain-containing protein [Tanacetum cinerariifolium]
MRTRSSSNLPVESPPNPSTSNPKRRNRRRSKTTNLRNEISNFQQRFDESFHEAWDRYKDLLRACPHHGFTELHQLDTFYNTLNPADQDSLNSSTGGNLLERRTQDVLTIIKNKSKQTSVVTTAMTAILKQFQATPPPAFVKVVEEICVTCGGAHQYYQCFTANGNPFPELRDNIQGYVAAAAVNYNQGNFGYRPLDQPYQASTQQNQVIPLSELEKIKRVNEANMKAMQTQINNVKNELRNEIQNSIQASIGIVLDGTYVPIPPPFINPEKDERVEETLTDQDLAEDPLHPNIPYPSRMLKQKQQEKDEVQIHKFWQMFEQLHINITFVDALILIPKYQKILKALLSNKEKLLELENTPLNENCSAVILKKLPKKLGDPGKFIIPCGFSEVKCKALANLGASINLMPLFVWKKLGLPELISTRMTLELANRAICTPAGIARDVFVPVGKFTFLVDFVIIDYESDPRVPFILGRPFLRTACDLIDVHGEEMILRDGDERLTLNIRHDTSSYPNQPQKESINMINVFNDSNDVFDPDQVLKPFFPSPIPDEDSDSFLEKSDTSLYYSDIYLPEFKTFIIHTEETNSGNTTTHTFYFDVEEKNSGNTTTYADISLPDVECFKFDFKPDPCELTSIIDSGIHENVPFATNMNLPPEEDHSPLFSFVVWIFLSFLTYPVIPPNLLSFRNEDTIFDPGIANYHFPSLLSDASHRCETFMKFNVYPKTLE